MDFSGIDRSSVVGRVLRAPLALIPDGARMRVLQGALRGKTWIAGAHSHGCWLGSYEHDKQQLFSALVKTGAVVYDVGAKAGFYTLLASELVGPSGHVVAFEVQPRELRYLRTHVRLNGLENVTVLELAVGDGPGALTLSSTVNGHQGTPIEVGDRKVRKTSLDALVGSCALPPPDFITMTLEDGELEALRGAREVLTRHRPTVLLATHDAEVHQACMEELRAIGYGLQSIDGRPLDRTHELLARA